MGKGISGVVYQFICLSVGESSRLEVNVFKEEVYGGFLAPFIDGQDVELDVVKVGGGREIHPLPGTGSGSFFW